MPLDLATRSISLADDWTTLPIEYKICCGVKEFLKIEVDMVMKKILYVLFFSAFSVLFSASFAVAASDVIGFIDPSRVLIAHPKYEQSQKHLNDFVAKKEQELRKAAENEKDPEKRRIMLDDARRASGDEEVRVMNPIQKQINDCIAKVAKARGVTVVLAKDCIFFGDIDLTEDVIKELKAIK